jgi:hypothetical protein
MRLHLAAVAAAVLAAACGGAGEPEPMLIDAEPRWAAADVVVLSGRAFVPAGSDCPASAEYVRIGTLGPHTITYTNAATGIAGPVFDELWVCNADDGESMRWTSNPITLAPGDNPITVTMVAGRRSASATVTLRPR